MLGLAISLVSTVPEKVWYCKAKGYKPWLKPKQQDVLDNEQGGHTTWYDEPALLQVRDVFSIGAHCEEQTERDTTLLGVVKLEVHPGFPCSWGLSMPARNTDFVLDAVCDVSTCRNPCFCRHLCLPPFTIDMTLLCLK